MSALPPKADFSSALCDVRFVPQADLCTAIIPEQVPREPGYPPPLPMRPETKSHDNHLTLRKSPTHVDPRQARLDIELRFQHTVGFDKSHTGVDREIFCHRHIGAELDSG